MSVETPWRKEARDRWPMFRDEALADDMAARREAFEEGAQFGLLWAIEKITGSKFSKLFAGAADMYVALHRVRDDLRAVQGLQGVEELIAVCEDAIKKARGKNDDAA